ncbi:succinate dehydrogenase/fumarate reductase iron-sulfur subunit [Nitratidesulfovibrio sp. SRB-5]|uniref:succinate dehydrogenase/fumarate reductase iron-sulfur subunit n=1 Tax=Nitratidesulfovibrio sp. SRB-5 TaxID=2872636 RepID=UPI001024F0C7|nr:2Fe-2S iron-sulfur cluster-binding protein [Nitratidesulfovibrio sp. SRB-5]MBZ2172672.1 4Fe-4S binding protein [Nitratidesulfovibrio sp. SRB-5]RXF76369.1 succinate dehydrogenase/fumarate reductase iron-sulfur subunit [Desulfovibrio sp. DS-1]
MSDAEKTAPGASAATPESGSPPAPVAASSPQQARTLTVRVLRSGPGGANARFDDYRLSVRPEDSVLDVLDRIRVETDPTLVYRHSCHHSSCGTCAMRINGRERLACITRMLALGTDVVTLEPLRSLPVLGDLMVDMRPMFAHIEPDWGYVRPVEKASTGVPHGVARYTRLENCIECGACMSACPVSNGTDDMPPATAQGSQHSAHQPTRQAARQSAQDSDESAPADAMFIGPAPLAALNRELARHPERREELLHIGKGPHGERHCRRHMACSRACPSGVYPAKDIMDIRMMHGGGKD